MIQEVSPAHMEKRPYVLILGSGEEAEKLSVRNRRSGSAACKLLGCLSLNGSLPSKSTNSLPILGTSDALREYVFRNPVDVVLVSVPLSPASSKELLEPVLEIGLTAAIPEGISVSLEPNVLAKTLSHRQRFFGTDATLLTTVRQRQPY